MQFLTIHESREEDDAMKESWEQHGMMPCMKDWKKNHELDSKNEGQIVNQGLAEGVNVMEAAVPSVYGVRWEGLAAAPEVSAHWSASQKTQWEKNYQELWQQWKPSLESVVAGQVLCVEVDRQQDWLNDWVQTVDGSVQIFSLDGMTAHPRVMHLECSRVFKKGFTWQSRPWAWMTGCIPWASTKWNECILIDDDIASGNTINFMANQLKRKGWKVIEIKSILNETHPHQNFMDVVDMRDFWSGTRNAGLWIEHNGQMNRVLYMDPEVDLWAKASIPKKHQETFRKEWNKIHENWKNRQW